MTIAKVPGRYMCERCKRAVDKINIEYECVTIPRHMGRAEVFHTGRVIVQIECHGQRWQKIYDGYFK